ncbi:MAG: tRNA (guanosine(37)-N1)-methyltransferase TrmD [Candidatus Latescibacteria bacterium]|nr:tRNA (guanosine(37)-N1)-methyltransferase TrmD [Candidatus Latescibacterota bacterium]
MKIEVVTLFPGFFTSPLGTSMVARAQSQGLAQIAVHDLRAFSADQHHTVDDSPYGGGGGMVIKPEPVARAWEALELGKGRCIYLSADGVPFDQRLAIELSLAPHLVLLCGHYKGVDERIRQRHIDQEVSVGDYVLTGGEPAALILIDAVVRLIPGVLGNFSSALEDSFQEDLLDCPWYTRPAVFAGQAVPEVLLSGDHQQVRAWRRREALRRTFERRPDLLARATLDEEEQRLVAQWRRAQPGPTEKS